MLRMSSVRDSIVEHLRPVPTISWPDGLSFPVVGVRKKAQAATWRVIVLQSTGLWLATRVAFVAITYFAAILPFHGPATGYVTVGPRTLLDMWQRSDEIWYMNIAGWGYWKAQATAFFPLYPILIKLATFVVGNHWLTASMLVANVGTLLAFIGLGLWAYDEEGTQLAAWRTIRVVAAYPLALFLFAGYSDGLFLGLVVFTFFFMRRGHWKWAALCAFLAGLTRPTGAALILPLFWEYGRQHGWWQRERWTQGQWRTSSTVRELGGAAVVVGAVPFAFALYMSFVWLKFHDPLMTFQAEQIYWHHTPMSPLATIRAVTRQFLQTPPWTYWKAHQLLDIVPVALFGLLTLLTVRRIPVAYTLYMLALTYLVIASPITLGYPDLLMSAERYMLAAAPMFLLLGRWMGHRPWLDMLLMSTGFMLQGVLTVVLLSGGWLI